MRKQRRYRVDIVTRNVLQVCTCNTFNVVCVSSYNFALSMHMVHKCFMTLGLNRIVLQLRFEKSWIYSRISISMRLFELEWQRDTRISPIFVLRSSGNIENCKFCFYVNVSMQIKLLAA